MRRMKKAGQYLLGIFAALLLCGVFSVNIVKAESQYVYDNASLLSDEEEQDLERSCTEFERNTKLHMVILTERSSGSEDCQAIADDFYDKKYPKEPNGVCFLIDMGQRQIVISTSGIMHRHLPAESIIQTHILRGGGQIFVASYYMSNIHGMVIYHVSKIVSRIAVGFDQDHIIQLGIIYGNVSV